MSNYNPKFTKNKMENKEPQKPKKCPVCGNMTVFYSHEYMTRSCFGCGWIERFNKEESND